MLGTNAEFLPFDAVAAHPNVSRSTMPIANFVRTHVQVIRIDGTPIMGAVPSDAG